MPGGSFLSDKDFLTLSVAAFGAVIAAAWGLVKGVRWLWRKK